MPLELGGAFVPRIVLPPPEPEPPNVENLRTEQIVAALSALREALTQMPPPVVNVAEPDLSAIVTAVTGLKGGATADEIAEAIVGQIGGDTRQPIEPVLEKLIEALKQLDFRLKGIAGTGGGGGGVGSHVVNKDGTALDTREAQSDSRFEWQSVASQSVPFYIGRAAPGTATTATTWRIDRYTYITGPAGDAVPSVVQSVTGAWDSRATLF
jgi:hypothetical protein